MTKPKKEEQPISAQAIREWLKQSKKKGLHGEKLDSNGYAPSLAPSDDCLLCGVGGDLARHEFFGGADRQTSKAVGLWGNLCPQCHDRAHADWEESMHEMGQRIYEAHYPHEEFMALFGRNYI